VPQNLHASEVTGILPHNHISHCSTPTTHSADVPEYGPNPTAHLNKNPTLNNTGNINHCVLEDRKGCSRLASGNGRAGSEKETERVVLFFLGFRDGVLEGTLVGVVVVTVGAGVRDRERVVTIVKVAVSLNFKREGRSATLALGHGEDE
jgi:hypothetical protein